MKHKTQNLISTVGLSIGLVCFTVCFYCTRFVIEVDDCFEHKNRIVNLVLADTIHDDIFSGTPSTLAQEVRSWGLAELEAVACVVYPHERPYKIEIQPDKILPYDLETMEVDSCFYRLFTPELIAGSWQNVCHAPNALVISESTAIRIFGCAEEAVGKQLISTRRLSSSPSSTPRTGGIGYTIQAVMRDLPLNNTLNFMKHTDLLVLNDSEGLIQLGNRKGVTGSTLYALMPQGTEKSPLEAAIDKRGYVCNMFDKEFVVKPRNLSLWSSFAMLATLSALLGGLILLAGLLNFFHFRIGSFLNQQREHSLRKVLGCSWQRLFLQLFVQVVPVILFVGLLTMCCFEWVGNALDFSLFTISMKFSAHRLMIHTMQYVAVILFLCAVVCAGVTLRIRHISIVAGLYGNSFSMRRRRGRNVMLGIQFFISFLFLGSTVALYLQSDKTTGTLLHTLTRREKSEILSIPLDYTFLKNEEKLAMIARFKQHAGVEDALLADISFLDGYSGNMIFTEKDNPDSWLEVVVFAVPANFFSFMKIPIEQGRGICTETDIVTDRSFCERMQREVVGMNLYGMRKDYTVCGICTSYNQDAYRSSCGVIFQLRAADEYVGHCYLKCRPGQVDEVRRWVEKVRKEMLPENIDSRVQTMLDDIHLHQAFEYNMKNIMLFFAVVCIAITLLAVYMGITLDTERRQREVAIRKVHGACSRDIAWLFARLYLIILIGSAAVAFPVIYILLIQWKRMYAVFFDYGFSYWAGIFICVAVVTGCTIFFRIRRIVRLNPAEVIKRE